MTEELRDWLKMEMDRLARIAQAAHDEIDAMLNDLQEEDS